MFVVMSQKKNYRDRETYRQGWLEGDEVALKNANAN